MRENSSFMHRLTLGDILAVLGDMMANNRILPPELRDMPVLAPEHFAAATCRELHLPFKGSTDIAHALGTFFGIRGRLFAPTSDTPLGIWANAAYDLTGGLPRTVTFQTSGSTGLSTSHALPYAWLAEEVALAAPMLPSCRIFNVTPRHHCFGFVYGLLLPRFTGRESRYFLPLPTRGFLEQLQPGDMITGPPFFWDALTRMGARLDGVSILSAGSPCAPELVDALLVAGAASITEIYGASELGAIGMRRMEAVGMGRGTPFTLLPQWNVVDEGRKDGARKLERALPEGGCARRDFPDILVWESERAFRVSGRRDKAVQIGGRNVYPQQVAARFMEHPHVAECRVRLMRPDEGRRLKAFIVLAPDATGISAGDMRKILVNWCRTLPPLAVPRHIVFGETLPRNVFGKDADW